MVSKLLPKNKPNSLFWKITTSRLMKKRVYVLFARRQTLFCINLEIVILQDREFGLFFGRSFETIIGFRNLLTFRHRQASCASACSSFVPYWKSPKLYRQLWTFQVLISVPSLLCWNANITGKSAQRASTNIICMLPWTLVKCRSIFV